MYRRFYESPVPSTACGEIRGRDCALFHKRTWPSLEKGIGKPKVFLEWKDAPERVLAELERQYRQAHSERTKFGIARAKATKQPKGKDDDESASLPGREPNRGPGPGPVDFCPDPALGPDLLPSGPG